MSIIVSCVRVVVSVILYGVALKPLRNEVDIALARGRLRCITQLLDSSACKLFVLVMSDSQAARSSGDIGGHTITVRAEAMVRIPIELLTVNLLPGAPLDLLMLAGAHGKVT